MVSLNINNKLNEDLLKENVTHFKKITKIIPCVTLYEISKQFKRTQSIQPDCRGSLFFFERKIGPTNGIFLFNKLNQKNFVYLITEETEIHVDGNYMYLRTSLEKYEHSDFLFLIHFVKSDEHQQAAKKVSECIQYAKNNNEGVEPFVKECRNKNTVPPSQAKLNILDMLRKAEQQKKSSVKPLSDFKEVENFSSKQHTNKISPTLQGSHSELKKRGKIDLNVLFSQPCNPNEQSNFKAKYDSTFKNKYLKHSSVKNIILNEEQSIVKSDMLKNSKRTIDRNNSKLIEIQKEASTSYQCKKNEDPSEVFFEKSQFKAADDIPTPCSVITPQVSNQNKLNIVGSTDIKLNIENSSKKILLPPSYFSKEDTFALNFFDLPIVTDQGVEVFTESFISLLQKNEQFRKELLLLWQRNLEDRKKDV